MACPIVSYTLRETLTISLPGKLRKELAKSAKAQHLTQSEFVEFALLCWAAVRRKGPGSRETKP